MSNNRTLEQILEWAREFRAGELTAEDIQDLFSTLEVSDKVALPLRKRIDEAKQELDAIRLGMCERGQHGEIERIFTEIEEAAGKCGGGLRTGDC